MGSPLQQRVVLVIPSRLSCQACVADIGQGFTAVHLGAIVATLWVLMLNGIVGFQLIDDGTPLSLGLILLSAAALFIGTGYIALDTAFSYSGRFDPSDNRNIGLYVLYQLAPLVFLAAFFLLETVLVLRVLGEKKPMRKLCTEPYGSYNTDATGCSVSIGCRSPLRHRTDLPVHRQHPHMSGNERQNQRSAFRNTLHPSCSRHDLGLLVKHHRGRLANASNRGHIHLMTAGSLFSFGLF